MKKIVFIGGTSRSGSTLLDLIIANDPKGMSLGEIQSIFRPTKRHHFKELNRLREDEKWKKILDGGKKNLYPNLIAHFPDIDLFVDSSKDPFWIKYQMKMNNENKMSLNNVLIYKTPAELANSFIKRGKEQKWANTYEKYHRKYLSLIDDFVSIGYRDLIENDISLEKLCNYIDIDFSIDKKEYWKKNYNTFFGSNSVKSENSHYENKQLSKIERRKLEYDGVKKEYADIIEDVILKNQILLKIRNDLGKRDVLISKIPENKSIYKYNDLYLMLLSLKKEITKSYFYYFPKDQFKKNSKDYKDKE